MRTVWLSIVAGMMVWPIHWTAATVSNKPIDLMASDLLPLLLPFTYFFARYRSTPNQMKWVVAPIRSHKMTLGLALVFVVYSTSLAGIGLGMSGETLRLYSAFKLAKPVTYIFLGWLIGSWTDPLEFIDVMGWVYGVIVGITMCFTVTAPDFPLGEWGKYIWEWELSGYPNSPMSFYGVMVPLLLAAVESSRVGYTSLIGWGLAACSAMMIAGSMSRSSTIALMIGLIVYLFNTGRVSVILGGGGVLIIMSIVGFGAFALLQETEFVAILTERIQERVERSTEQEDPSSGRFDIWALAIELWTERPIFGYMFESFSRYASVDTPHQQYLEVLHKCGGLGIILYVGILVSCLSAAIRLLRIAPPKSGAWYRLSGVIAMLSGVMVGNLTQPNLTYSLTGNLVFLVFGCLCSSRATISASQPSSNANWNIPRKPPVPLSRAAA